jgi:DNA (cytosine-5)-methyltransferase 1
MNLSNIKTIELFAGIGGFRLAANELGLNSIWANDICQKAGQVYRHNFGNQELVGGDIRDLFKTIPNHDLLTAGFPCQPFSSAGKKEGIRDIKGTFFKVIVDVLQIQKPRYFVLENVKRLLSMESGQHFAIILEALASLGYLVEWRLVNASHFGLAQNRERVIIIGNKIKPNEPLKLRLINQEEINNLPENIKEKISQQWTSISEYKKPFPHWGIAYQSKFKGENLNYFAEQQKKVVLLDILEDKVAPEFDFTASTIERINNSEIVNRFVNGVEIFSNQSGGARMGYTVFGIHGLAPTLTATASRHYERYKIGDQFRRLTNIEYARLQGFPDNFAQIIPVYYQYSLYGNALPPPLAKWGLIKVLSTGIELKTIKNNIQQLRLALNV